MTDQITQLIHHPYQPPAGFEAPQPGVFKASTVFFPTVASMRSREWMDKSGYTYGLHGTPTSYVLEERLASLEGGAECLLVPSGLAALGLVALSLLKSGDEVLLPDNVYGPNKSIVEGELRGWGITHQYYNPMDPEDLEAQISSRTKLVWLEAAGSVSLEFPNIVDMVRICQRRKVLTALDNTWGAGLAFHPFDLLPGASSPVAVDISAHALTKYPSGGGDVLMGSVITRNAALHLKLKLTHMRFGFGVGMNDVEAVLRSLSSIGLRYRAHDAATRSLAAWAQTQPEFVQVLHPALPESPGHRHWMALTGGEEGTAAGLFSVILDARFTRAQTDAFCDALRLFKLGYSWGGPISLVVPYELERMRMAWPEHLLRGTLVRFSIGLENVADLQADIAQALEVLR
nr:PLP-dependent transferase [uncultured Rhodoferax sp.]